MTKHDIVVVGASAGGIEAIKELSSGLPPDLPAAVFVVTHLPDYPKSILPEIISGVSGLPALHAIDGEPIRLGRMYVAVPGQHLTIEQEQVRLTQGASENGFRPAIDTLFRSAARAYGQRVVGVVLTGLLDDGTGGLVSIKRRGGVAIVQDPETARFPDMPRNAMTYVEVDYCLPLSEIAPKITALVLGHSNDNPGRGADPDQISGPRGRMERNLRDMEEGEGPEGPALSACPACGGVLLEMQKGNLLQFECRVGHRYSPESLMTRHSDTVERALWVALRSLEEHGALAKRMANHWRDLQSQQIADRFDEKANEAEENAQVLRKVLGEDGHPR